MQNTNIDTECCSSTSCCESAPAQERISQQKTPCCSSSDRPEWVCGSLETPVGTVSQISANWTRNDRWGQIKARTTSFRMKYTVPPGLYAIGTPDQHAEVFVSANYKLSFDVLRRELQGMNAWILVLDTKGINVWCAAGKGTFGTDELVKRIADVQLHNVVEHRRLIVPQLGAPGVNAAAVKKQTGFRVYFGPVQAHDIPAYVNAKYTATQDMRTIAFPLKDRLVLTPMEIMPMLKKFSWYALIVLILFGLQPTGILFKDAWDGGWPFLALGLLAILAGAFLTPILLPFVPVRSFAIKGAIVGLIGFLIVQISGVLQGMNVRLTAIAALLFPLAASYIALQFTGSTPFTGISGVKKELGIGIPMYIIGVVLSIGLFILYKLSEWGIV